MVNKYSPDCQYIPPNAYNRYIESRILKYKIYTVNLRIFDTCVTCDSGHGPYIPYTSAQ